MPEALTQRQMEKLLASAVIEERPKRLQENRDFFGKYRGAELEAARRTYNHLFERINFSQLSRLVGEGLSEAETRELLAQSLTSFQEFLYRKGYIYIKG